jgi:hypothetical protein
MREAKWVSCTPSAGAPLETHSINSSAINGLELFTAASPDT